MIRSIAMAAGLAGAVALSQFPEFSQQYLQRLSGAVHELEVIVFAVDATAAGAGLSREEALAELSDTEFRSGLRDTLAERIARYERLHADYEALKGTAPLARLAQPWRFGDADLLGRTWATYRPAVPVTADGLLAAGIGFAAGWTPTMGLFGGLRRLLRRRA